MRVLVAIVALAALIAAEETQDIKSKRAPVQSSKTNNANLNSFQEFQNSGKSPSSDVSTYSINDIDSQTPQANYQSQIPQTNFQSQIPQTNFQSQIPQTNFQSQIPQQQSQYLIPAQYLSQIAHQQQSNVRPQQIPYQIPQQYHQQPIQMVLIPHPMAHASNPSGAPLSYTSPTPLILTPHANMLFNQAAQQLLHYYQTHPQARQQLMQGYQPHYQQAIPQHYQAAAAQPAGVGQLALYHQSPQLSNIAAVSPTHFQPIHQPAIQYQQPQASPQYSQTPSTSASTASLNTLEYLPQAEKLTAANPSYLSQFALRNAYKQRF